MKSRIAYIDDERTNLDCLSAIFGNEFVVDTFLEPREFLATQGQNSYASILVDLHMPSMSGLELYEQILGHVGYNGCPILFVSSDISDSAKHRCFELGSVDFIGREVCPEEILARVKSKIHFFKKHNHLIEFDSLKVNLTQLKIYVNGLEVPLTFIEFKLLCLALRHFPEVILKKEVAEQIWRAQIADSIVHTHLCNLNSKLDGWGYEVQSVKGKGIQLIKKEK